MYLRQIEFIAKYKSTLFLQMVCKNVYIKWVQKVENVSQRDTFAGNVNYHEDTFAQKEIFALCQFCTRGHFCTKTLLHRLKLF